MPQITPTTMPRRETCNRMSGVTDMAPRTTITLTVDQLKLVVNAAVETNLGRRGETLIPPLLP